MPSSYGPAPTDPNTSLAAGQHPARHDEVWTAVDAKVAKTATGTTGQGTITFDFSAATASGSGTRGLKLNRPALAAGGPSDLPLGLTLQTNAVSQWDVVTLDAFSDDLVVFGDHFVNGAGTPALFGDQLRFAHGGHGEFGRSVGLQSKLRRFCFSSQTGDSPDMANLLLLQLKDPGSPVIFPLNIVAGELGSTSDLFSVSNVGAVKAFGSVTAGGLTAKGSAVGGHTTGVTMENTTGVRSYRIAAGAQAVNETGFSIRDLTNNRELMVGEPGGNVRLANACTAGDLATTATNGYLVIPQTNGKPTGVPTAYGGTSGGAMTFDRSNGRLYVYVNGTGWRGVALTDIP
jgi:hypothetical protein